LRAFLWAKIQRTFSVLGSVPLNAINVNLAIGHFAGALAFKNHAA
jgi:hypothetical protein